MSEHLNKGEVIYSDAIGYLSWFDGSKAVLHSYFDENEFATEDEFLQHIKNMTEKIAEYRPIGMIEDYANLRFVASPQIQMEIAKIVKPVLLDIGLRRYAKLVKQGDLVAELQAEQMVDQARKVSQQVIPDKVFTSLADALEWIDTALD